MKISLKWLSEFFPHSKFASSPTDKAELRARLPFLGLEIGGVQAQGAGLEGVRVAEIKSFEKHPQADRLNICQVSMGEGTDLQIVCGAPNVRQGMRVALATIGSVLPGNFEIKASKIRGVDSSGMLCSGKELGLTQDGEGILDLSSDYKLGSRLVDAMGLDDEIWEVELTPDRADCLSHLGLAREVGRLIKNKVQLPEFENLESATKDVALVSVEVQATEACSIYTAVLFEGVERTTTPPAMKQRLESLGHRSLGALVDVTNYVAQELGHPLHAFDADKIKGSKIIVRFAKPGETLVTLEGTQRTLHPEDLVIADLEKPLALAGVMGGLESGVSDATKRIVLESAVFDPIVIRKMAQRHRIHSEASHRFERGVDPNNTLRAAGRAALLFRQTTGARRRGAIIEVSSERGKRSQQKLSLNFDLRAFHKLVGIEDAQSDSDAIINVFSSVGIDAQVKSTNVLKVEIPTHRVDLFREVDLIEEAARLLGYDKIPERYPAQKTQSSSKTYDLYAKLRRVRSRVLDTGLCEMMPYCFVSDRQLSKLQSPRAVELENPLSADWKYLRPNLFLGLSGILSNHVALGQHDARIFDAGHVFEMSTSDFDPTSSASASKIPVRESYHVSWAIMGRSCEEHWSTDKTSIDRKRLVDFYDARGVFDKLVPDLAAIEGRWTSTQFIPLQDFLKNADWMRLLEADAPWIPVKLLHPSRSAVLVWPGKPPGKIVGFVGELHPMEKSDWLNLPTGLSLGAAVGEIRVFDDLGRIMGELRAGKIEKEASPYGKIGVSRRVPIVERDISLVFGPEASHAEIEKTVQKSVGGGLLRELRCMDLYQMPDGKRSLAYRLYLQGEGTLSDAEIQGAVNQAVEGLKKKFGAEIR